MWGREQELWKQAVSSECPVGEKNTKIKFTTNFMLRTVAPGKMVVLLPKFYLSDG